MIITLAANTMRGDEEECLAAGMNDYLGKPAKLEEVIRQIAEMGPRLFFQLKKLVTL